LKDFGQGQEAMTLLTNHELTPARKNALNRCYLKKHDEIFRNGAYDVKGHWHMRGDFLSGWFIQAKDLCLAWQPRERSLCCNRIGNSCLEGSDYQE